MAGRFPLRRTSENPLRAKFARPHGGLLLLTEQRRRHGPDLCRNARNDNALSFGPAPAGQGTFPRGRFAGYYAAMLRILDLTFGERLLSDVRRIGARRGRAGGCGRERRGRRECTGGRSGRPEGPAPRMLEGTRAPRYGAKGRARVWSVGGKAAGPGREKTGGPVGDGCLPLPLAAP